MEEILEHFNLLKWRLTELGNMDLEHKESFREIAFERFVDCLDDQLINKGMSEIEYNNWIKDATHIMDN